MIGILWIYLLKFFIILGMMVLLGLALGLLKGAVKSIWEAKETYFGRFTYTDFGSIRNEVIHAILSSLMGIGCLYLASVYESKVLSAGYVTIRETMGITALTLVALFWADSRKKKNRG